MMVTWTNISINTVVFFPHACSWAQDLPTSYRADEACCVYPALVKLWSECRKPTFGNIATHYPLTWSRWLSMVIMLCCADDDHVFYISLEISTWMLEYHVREIFSERNWPFGCRCGDFWQRLQMSLDYGRSHWTSSYKHIMIMYVAFWTSVILPLRYILESYGRLMLYYCSVLFWASLLFNTVGIAFLFLFWRNHGAVPGSHVRHFHLPFDLK